MANIKVQFDNIIREIKMKVTKLSTDLKIDTAALLAAEIEDSITKGISPVAGEGRFDTYSKSYKDQIGKGYLRNKKQTPVNLKVTGKMRKSLKTRFTYDGFTLFYSSPIAKYHNDLGAGKSKVIRKMLPGAGQKFSNSIIRKIDLNNDKLVSKIFR